jgi:heptosyltransferase III
VKRTVVIIHPGALGDVLLAVPAMRRLRARFPDHRFILSAAPEVSKLLAACGLVDEWMSLQTKEAASFFAEGCQLAPRWQEWFSSCDLAVGWMQDTEGAFAARLTSFGAREAVVRSPLSDDLKAVHQSDRFLEIIGEHPENSTEGFLRSEVIRLQHSAQEYLQPNWLPDSAALSFIHPGSGSRAKCAGTEIFVPMVRALHDKVMTPVILEGPADYVQVEQLLQALPAMPFVLKGLDLVTVAGLLAQGALFIGHDSGLTHLAALVGIPTVALFGPTDPDRWAPRAAQVTILNGGPGFNIQASQVLSACLAHVLEGVHR